jgi:hypothetical protein
MNATRRNTSAAMSGFRTQWEFLGQISAWVLGSVGGFLQPLPYSYPSEPDTTLKLGAFVARILIGLLFVPTSIWKDRRHTAAWFGATILFLAVALMAFFKYQDVIDSCVVAYRGEKVLKGIQETTRTRNRKKTNPEITDQQLLDIDNASRRELIWTAESIHYCQHQLQEWYVLDLPLFSMCLICLLQTIRCLRDKTGAAEAPVPSSVKRLSSPSPPRQKSAKASSKRQSKGVPTGGRESDPSNPAPPSHQ